MALTPSDFFSEILDYYVLQPHHIALNSVLVIAGFQSLFDGYLGTKSDIVFFKYYFHVRRQTIPDGSGLATCGSVTFYCR